MVAVTALESTGLVMIGRTLVTAATNAASVILLVRTADSDLLDLMSIGTTACIIAR